MPEMKFDLAISLLDRDESVANAVYRQLKDQYKVFLYSESQKDIEYTNGVEVLSEIYRRQSRLVLTLLRPAWGTTKWTRVEQGAITSRIQEEGTTFFMGLLMEDMQTPAWIPPSYFYQKANRFVEDVFVGAVRKKLAEVNAEIHVPSAVEIVRRQREERDWDTERRRLLMSSAAKKEFDAQVIALKGNLSATCAEIAEIADSSGAVNYAEFRGRVALRCGPLSLTVQESFEPSPRPYTHSLTVAYFDGVINAKGEKITRRAEMTSEEQFAIDVSESGAWFWTETTTQKPYTTAALAEHVLKRLVTRAHQAGTGEIRLTVRDPDMGEFRPISGDFPLTRDIINRRY